MVDIAALPLSLHGVHGVSPVQALTHGISRVAFYLQSLVRALVF